MINELEADFRLLMMLWVGAKLMNVSKNVL